jgi:hypothetical protein
MPQTSKIDHHPKRHEIEQAMVRGVPYRRIKELFQVSISAISRHKDRVSPQLLGAARAARDGENSELVKATDKLLAQMNMLQRRVKRSKKRDTVQAGDLLLKISREVRALLELRERLAGPRVGAAQPQAKERAHDDEDEAISEAEADQIARRWLAQRTPKAEPGSTEAATASTLQSAGMELSR